MCKYSEKEMLQWLCERGTIAFTTIEREMDMKKRQEYLDSHDRSIWQGKNGFWYTTFPCEESTNGRRMIRRQTRELLNDAIADYYKAKDEEPTFEQTFHMWIEDKLRCEEICKGTYDRYVQDYARFLKGTSLSRKKIKNITETDIEDLIRDNICEKDLKRKAFAGMRTIIIGTYKYAKRRKYTDLSISSFFNDLDLSKRMFKRDVKNDEEQVFTEDETPVMIYYLKKHPTLINLGILLCFKTGLRTGELIALKFSDVIVREDERCIHVQRQQIRYTDKNGKTVYEIVDYTKTEDGNRYVRIPKDTLDIIRQIRLLNPFQEYMFPNVKKYWFNNQLYRNCKACGIPKKSMHKVRKTYATMLIDNGVEDTIVTSQMGHRDIQTTHQYYTFVRKNNKHILEQIEKAVNL